MPDDRIRESELNIPILKLLNAEPNGFLETSALIKKLEDGVFDVQGEDAEILPGRGDSKFSQKVRNIVSHKGQSGNIIHDGYVEHVDNGLRITPKGKQFLQVNGHI